MTNYTELDIYRAMCKAIAATLDRAKENGFYVNSEGNFTEVDEGLQENWGPHEFPYNRLKVYGEMDELRWWIRTATQLQEEAMLRDIDIPTVQDLFNTLEERLS